MANKDKKLDQENSWFEEEENPEGYTEDEIFYSEVTPLREKKKEPNKRKGK